MALIVDSLIGLFVDLFFATTNNQINESTNQQKMKLYTVEKISLCYNALTSIVILIFAGTIAGATRMLEIRALIALAIFATAYAYGKMESKNASRGGKSSAPTPAMQVLSALRYFFHLALLAYWYPETFEFNRYLPNLDHVFVNLEQTLFGSQPSLIFSQMMPQKWFNELMNLGYFSYFPLIWAVVVIFYVSCREHFEKAINTIVAGFFIYYLIFIVVPVAGPQYYFPASRDAACHVSTTIGTYFDKNENITPETVPDAYLFRELVKSAQKYERPTGAFPSSHVGITTILMLLLWFHERKWVYIFAPVYGLLVMSTVYIKAHYLVDVPAGIISAVLIYWGLQKLWNKETQSLNFG